MSPCTSRGPTGAPNFSILEIKSCCADGGSCSRACGLSRDEKNARSRWITMRWIASLPKSRPSFAIACLFEESHQNPAPINARRMITMARTCPDDLDREFIFNSFILIAETKALNHFAITNQCAMALHPRVSAETISSVHFEIDEISVEMFRFRPQIGRFRIAIPFNACACRVDQLCVEPFYHDLFVVARIWSITVYVRWLSFRV